MLYSGKTSRTLLLPTVTVVLVLMLVLRHTSLLLKPHPSFAPVVVYDVKLYHHIDPKTDPSERHREPFLAALSINEDAESLKSKAKRDSPHP